MMLELIEKFAGGLFLVVPLIWAFVYVYSRYSGGGKKGQKGLMRVVTNMPLGPKKSISVVNIAGKYLVLGVSAEQINFLTSIEDSTVTEKLEKGSGKGTGGSGENLITKILNNSKENFFGSFMKNGNKG
ncbi:MAG: flagellar biosynthetic protein FliO [Thermodesulfobacteriota bacterium]